MYDGNPNHEFSQSVSATAATFQEALDQAVNEAQGQLPGADMLLEWQMIAVCGTAGGITGRREVEVKIAYRTNQ